MGLPLGSAARPLTWGRSSRESTLIQRCPCRPPYRVDSPPPFSSSSPHSGSRGLRTYTPPRPARRLFHTASRPVRRPPHGHPFHPHTWHSRPGAAGARLLLPRSPALRSRSPAARAELFRGHKWEGGKRVAGAF